VYDFPSLGVMVADHSPKKEKYIFSSHSVPSPPADPGDFSTTSKLARRVPETLAHSPLGVSALQGFIRSQNLPHWSYILITRPRIGPYDPPRPTPFNPIFSGLYDLIRLRPYLGLDCTDYWKLWLPCPQRMPGRADCDRTAAHERSGLRRAN